MIPAVLAAVLLLLPAFAASQVAASQQRSNEFYQRGMEFARAAQWDQARDQFQSGRALAPLDKRFPIELAGVEYRAGKLTEARRLLHAALRLDPTDAYANSFLGTLYFYDTNLDAALQYWNRANGPRIGSIRTEPAPLIPDTLLDRAIAFAPGEILLREQYQSTLAWLQSLGVLGTPRIDLEARPDDRYDVVISWTPPNGWVRAAGVLRGVPVQTLNGGFRNLGQRAIGASTSWRWDAQKRRVFGEIDGPIAGDPRRHFTFSVDARSETWHLLQPADFRLNKVEGAASLRFIPNGRFSWETGLRLASRSFSGTSAYYPGFTAAQTASARYRIMQRPEHGLTLDADAGTELGRAFSPGLVYSISQASLFADWLPAPNSPARYEASARVSFGRAFGSPPFDELFILGRSSDDAILLRGFAATSEGKKGRAPIGRQYYLTNLDVYRQIWKPSMFAIDAGLLLDSGRISHQPPGVVLGRLVVTPGLQFRLRMRRGFTAGVSYALDVRNGGGAFNLFLSR